MEKRRFYIALIGALFICSVILYAFQIIIFNRPLETEFYLFQDLAFLPLQVLLVTLIVDQLLKKRERSSLLKKLNMVVGSFFSDSGLEMLKLFITFNPRADQLRDIFSSDNQWSDSTFTQVLKQVESDECLPDLNRGNLPFLREFLIDKRSFILTVMENPNLLEHEQFTDLLWAITHLTEELTLRSSLDRLTPNDAAHLAGDLQRAYHLILREWFLYMQHLKREYPYIFSLYRRTNPFDRNAKVEFD